MFTNIFAVLGVEVAHEHAWSETTLNRVAAACSRWRSILGCSGGVLSRNLLAIICRNEASLPPLCLREAIQSPRKILASDDWRMFLMRPADVEHELLRLHQFEARLPGCGEHRAALLPCAVLRVCGEDGGMSDLVHRIKTISGPLELSDPRERISAYHDMPYALFRYEPEEEFALASR